MGKKILVPIDGSKQSFRAIVKAASDKSVGMIVMGNRGLGTVKGLAFGNTSQKLSHLTLCSVITVT